MAWYAASVILYTEMKEEPQQEYPVLENVYLFDCPSDEEAQGLAERRGRETCAASEEGMTWQGKPARFVYGGVRKIILCSPDASEPGALSVETMKSGVEATYSFFVVSSREDLEALVRG